MGKVTPLRLMFDGRDESRKKKSVTEATVVGGWGSSSKREANAQLEFGLRKAIKEKQIVSWQENGEAGCCRRSQTLSEMKDRSGTEVREAGSVVERAGHYGWLSFDT